MLAGRLDDMNQPEYPMYVVVVFCVCARARVLDVPYMFQIKVLALHSLLQIPSYSTGQVH